MATIQKKPSGSFEVQWYIDKKRRSKTFKTKKEAREYALSLEASPAERGSMITFRALIEEYIADVSIKKRGHRNEIIRLKQLAKNAIADKTLTEVTRRDLQNYVDLRLSGKGYLSGTLQPATIIREFSTIKAIFNYAVSKELLKETPAKNILLPKPPAARERVASEEEQALIQAAAGWDGESVPENTTQLTALAFLFSCRTGMRSGEILKLDINWIDGSVIHLPKEATKTATKRDVALSSDALRLLDLALARKKEASPRVFEPLTAATKDSLWRKIRDRAGLGPVVDSFGNLIKEGLNFHDGRATFATWAASPDPKTGAPRLDVLALARQTGHRDLKNLQRYYRMAADEIAKRLG